MSALHRTSRASLAVAGILSMPLFFASLMAMSLAVEKPHATHVLKGGQEVVRLADPTGSTEARIWLLAILPSLVLLVVGGAAMRLGRAGVGATAIAAIAISIALLVPLGRWDREHAARFPQGVDLIPRSAGSEDIYLRGEWEANAKRAAEQLGLSTIGIGGAALVALLLLEVRRRRGTSMPPPPPPPALATGGAPTAIG
ncbi:MAG: hypothetical protein ACXVRJ_04690 [Gaiellaceae bacterium]